MNTLNKKITELFYTDATGYNTLVTRWREIAHNAEASERLKCEHYLLYAILRGKNWQKAITPITNRRKLDNGAQVGWAGGRAYRHILQTDDIQELLRPFGETLREDVLHRVRALLRPVGYYGDPLAEEPYVD